MNDPEEGGSPSDHQIVIANPNNSFNNTCSREYRTVKVRPLPESGIRNIQKWFINQTWDSMFKAKSSNEKAKIL